MFPTDILTTTLTAKEAAKIMNCSPQTIRVQCEQGKILGEKINTKTGPQWRIFKIGPFADVDPVETPPDGADDTSVSLPALPPDDEVRYLQPGVVEALALLREERERNAVLTQENISLREQLAARPSTLALPEPEKAPMAEANRSAQTWWPPWRRWFPA
jgi:hypothetical protein